MDFLHDYENKQKDDIQKITSDIQDIERATGRKIPPELFNLMVGTAENINDNRSALRAFHWLKDCIRVYESEQGHVLEYSDANQAVWALNYIREGIKPALNASNVHTVFEGRIIDSLIPYDRKRGNVLSRVTTKHMPRKYK